MLRIFATKQFKKSLQRLKRAGLLKKKTEEKLTYAVDMLASGKKLPKPYKDHQLKGALAAYRECHLQGDLLLIYTYAQEGLVLVLVDIGSHAAVFK
mgnify:CR=1 FL=1